ncbi:MAG: glycine oxidase ThiO [Parvularculaceae bacterium]
MSGKSVVIAGGGVIGLALGWRLAEEGALVTLIDAGAEAPAATNAAAGMLAPSFEHCGGAVAEPLYDLSLASLKRWPDFAARLEAATGVPIDFRRDGVMGVAFDTESAAEFAQTAADIDVRGGNVRILNRERAIAREPSLSDRTVAALWAPDDAQVDPRLLSAALRRAIKRHGGTLIDGRVRDVAPKGAGLIATTHDGASFLADAVVIAAGVTTARIGLPAPQPPIFPVKGEALALKCDGLGPKCVVRAPGAYICPKADGRLVIGATAVPHETSLDPSPEAIEILKAAAIAAAPSIRDCPELERWAGLRPATPDGAPVLGADSRGPANLYFAVGHYRNGVLLAPETAALLAPAILSGKPLRTNPFRPERFASAATV